MNARSDCGEPIDGASSPSKIPIADVLSRAGHELAHIAWLLENFQTHLSPLIQEAAARDQNALHQMQTRLSTNLPALQQGAVPVMFAPLDARSMTCG
jgi:hypothetical protein